MEIKDNMTLDEFVAVSKEIYEKTGCKTNMAYGVSQEILQAMIRGYDGHVLFCHPLSFPDFPKTETDMLRILISILLVFTVFYKIKPIIFCVFYIIIRNHVFLQELSVNEKAAIRILLPDNGLLYDCYLKIPFFLCFSPSELSPPIASSNLRSASF